MDSGEFHTPNPRPILTLDAAPDDRTVVVGQQEDGTTGHGLSLWTLPDWRPGGTLVTDESSLAARFAPSGKALVYSDGEQRLAVFDRASQARRTLPIPFVKWIGFAGTVDRFVAGGSRTEVWDVERDTAVWTLPVNALPETRAISPPCCALSPNGGRLAASGVEPLTIAVYDIRTGDVVRRISHSMDAARSMAFDPSGTFVAAVAMTGAAGLWEAETGEQVLSDVISLRADNYWSVRFHPDGRRVAFSLWSGFVELFDLSTGVELLKQSTPSHHGTVRDLAFTADGRLLMSGGDDGRICVWNLA